MFSKCLDHATSVQVLCGHTPWNHRIHILQPRMVGVRVLDVVDAGQDSDPEAPIHHPMEHPHIAGPIPSQKRSERRFDLPMVILRKDRISSRARLVANHQDRHLFPGKPLFFGPPLSSLHYPRKNVSLFSMMPLSFRALRVAGKARNRFLHRKAAFVSIPHCQVFLVPPLDRSRQIISLSRCHGANSSKTSLRE